MRERPQWNGDSTVSLIVEKKKVGERINMFWFINMEVTIRPILIITVPILNKG